MRRLAAVLLASILLSSCGRSSSPETVAALSPETISIATDATFAPFHYIDESGRVTGYDIELARQLAIRAGFEPEVIVVPYADLFDGLLAGQYNVVAATTGITAERQQSYRFSDPYFDTCQAALVRSGPKRLFLGGC